MSQNLGILNGFSVHKHSGKRFLMFDRSNYPLKKESVWKTILNVLPECPISVHWVVVGRTDVNWHHW